MKRIEINDPASLQSLAANMKREATLGAKGESAKPEFDFLVNNCRLFADKEIMYSLMLSVDHSNSKGRYWHLSVGSVSTSRPIPPDDLCQHIVSNMLGEGEILEGTPDPRRPNVRHFLKKIV
jgi:hypothetical protein